MVAADPPRERHARCGCGAFTATARGEPVEVHACSCLNCQRESGSAFTYGAIYPQAAVSLAGEHRTWRRTVESGRWLESQFCPTCGVAVCYRMEAWPDVIGISVGCFADPKFTEPGTLYWASRRHRWLKLPGSVRLVETQAE